MSHYLEHELRGGMGMRGKIFINYRRDDTLATAGRLHDRLSKAFGHKNIFMDVDRIPAGVDFVGYLNQQVAAADVFLAIIGPDWLTSKDDNGKPRLENPNDFVLVEIAAALNRNARVIPVLVDRTLIPHADNLPDPIKSLVRRHAINVRNTHFGSDADQLIEKIRDALNGGRSKRTAVAVGIITVAMILLAVSIYRTELLSLPWSAASNQPEVPSVRAKATEVQVNLKAEDADRKRAALLKSEQERAEAKRKTDAEFAAKAAADAQAKRKAEEAEQQRLALLKAEQERAAAEAKRKAEAEIVAKAAADAQARRKAEEAETQRIALLKDEQDRAAVETKRRADLQKKSTDPKERSIGQRFRDCTDGCPEMIVVPGGAFLMGSDDGESSEKPPHRVVIPAPFAVAEFEATFAEWDACIADGGCKYRPDDKGWGRGNRPVIYVSWHNVTREYLPWLSAKAGKPYRLLTEAEWEFVARANTNTAYSWGNDVGRKRAHCNGCTTEWIKHTELVGSFAPNGFGVYDMHGNVYELTQDCWNESYRGAPIDGTAWTTGDCNRHVVRGGSWFTAPKYLRSAARDADSADYRNSNVGFRVARTF
jgi:formylglycine-generating enzyme required for sulfatase activity